MMTSPMRWGSCGRGESSQLHSSIVSDVAKHLHPHLCRLRTANENAAASSPREAALKSEVARKERDIVELQNREKELLEKHEQIKSDMASVREQVKPKGNELNFEITENPFIRHCLNSSFSGGWRSDGSHRRGGSTKNESGQPGSRDTPKG